MTLHLDSGDVALSVGAGSSPAVTAALRQLDGRQVAFFRLEGG